LTYESEDFCFALPVRERRASARERLLSYREPASRNLQDVHPETRLGNPCTRAPFRLLSIRAPRQAELRTSSWLAPSSTTRPCDRTAAKTRDATDRCLPPIRTTCTRTSRVSSSLSPLSRRGHPTESWAPWRWLENRVFHDTRERFGGPSSEHCSRTYCLTAFWLRAWAFSSHGADAIEPLTPLSRPLLFPTPRPPS